MVRLGSDFSGVGAANVALKRLGVGYKEVFACDMDRYARITFRANHGEPDYFPKDVYKRAIPEKPLDLYVTSPPCQSFSLSGQRKGEDDDRGVLFYNSYEFIKKNKPKYFVFENVRGLLSVDGGVVFKKWIDLLGGLSVNRELVMFPHEDALPYNIHYAVLNAKDYGVPQNRERVFIVGIREDLPNRFIFPQPVPLKLKLKDVLDSEVDKKYYLSERMIRGFIVHRDRHKEKGNGFGFNPVSVEDRDVSQAVTCGYGSRPSDLYIKSATKAGYELAREGDGVNFSRITSNTRRERVGRGVSQTIETSPAMGVVLPDAAIRKLTPREVFRLMDFPDDFDISKVSDTQAYKQAGNSVVVKMYELIFKRLLFSNKKSED